MRSCCARLGASLPFIFAIATSFVASAKSTVAAPAAVWSYRNTQADSQTQDIDLVDMRNTEQLLVFGSVIDREQPMPPDIVRLGSVKTAPASAVIPTRTHGPTGTSEASASGAYHRSVSVPPGVALAVYLKASGGSRKVNRD